MNFTFYFIFFSEVYQLSDDTDLIKWVGKRAERAGPDPRTDRDYEYIKNNIN